MRNYIWGILSAICFGSLSTLGKLLLIDTNPETVLLLRFTIACSIIILIYVLTQNLSKLKVLTSDIKYMLIAGLAFSFETIGFWIALEHLDIIELLALFWTFPLMIYLINCLLDKYIDYRAILLFISGSIGVFMVTSGL